MPTHTPVRHPLNAAAAAPAGDKSSAKPSFTVTVAFDDMRQDSYGLLQAAERQTGLRLRIQSPQKIRCDGDASGNIGPCEFHVLPPLSWLIKVLEESVGVLPAPFAMTLAFAPRAGETGAAYVEPGDPRRPATALGGCTVTPLLRRLVESNPGKTLLLAELKARFAAGDYGKISYTQQAANQKSRAVNQGEVVGLYPGEDPGSQPLLITQKLPYEQGPCLMLQSERRSAFSGRVGPQRR